MTPVSELLIQSWRLYQKHFGFLAGYVAWLLLPFAGLVLFSLPETNVFLETLSILGFLAQGLLALWLGILIPLLVRELIKGQAKIPTTNIQNKAWRLIPSVLFVAIFETVVVLGGLVLLVIPAFIFWVWFALAQFSAILDNKKGMEAMAWSRELVRGRFWKTAWRLIAGPAAIFIAISLVVGLFVSLVAAVSGLSFDTVFGPTLPLWIELVSTVAETFSLPLFLIYFTLLYLDLVNITNQEILDKTA